MALTIYGHPDSRTMRVLWAAHELGLDYTHVAIRWDDPALKEPQFLRINLIQTAPQLFLRQISSFSQSQDDRKADPAVP